MRIKYSTLTAITSLLSIDNQKDDQNGCLEPDVMWFAEAAGWSA